MLLASAPLSAQTPPPGNIVLPTFTGDARADFNIPGAFTFLDPGAVDVGVPRDAAGNSLFPIAGWDVRQVSIFYANSGIDTLFVGIDCYLVCGDVDGDGDAGFTTPLLQSFGGVDRPDLGGTETFAFLIDTDKDYKKIGPTEFVGDFEAVVGVSAFTDINSFGIYNFQTSIGSLFAPGVGFGSLLSGASASPTHNPSAGRPDIEFTIENFSQLPGFTFQPGEPFSFQVNVFLGSFEDVGFGEENIPGGAEVTIFEMSFKVDVEKATNGEDADNPTGPAIPIGGEVTWSYVVTNTGEFPLTGLRLVDDNGTSADSRDDVILVEDATLAPQERLTFQRTGVAQEGQYANIATVTASNTAGIEVGDTDPSHYLGVTPGIDIEKATNGFDADSQPGPQIVVGDPVTWTYVVTNGGTVPITEVTIVDDNGTPADPSDDVTIATIAELLPDESREFSRTGVAQAGQYGNVARASSAEGPSDSDPSHYVGTVPGVDLEKTTNGFDADDPPGPEIAIGSTVTWHYVVRNVGDTLLTNVTVIDDNGTPGSSADDFEVASGVRLEPGESITFVVGSHRARAGLYRNIATVTTAEGPSDVDPSHYFAALSSVSIEKQTNGEDADLPTGPRVNIGDPVTWTYIVTNDGTLTVTNLVVTDDNGTPADPADDVVIGTIAALAPNEQQTLTLAGIAVEGQYANVGCVAIGGLVEDCDPSHHYGIIPSIDLEKHTNGEDADTGTGPLIPVGDPVTWRYIVTNTDIITLNNVTVTDDNGTPADDTDDVVVVTGITLLPGAVFETTIDSVAQLGEYRNLASVTATEGPTDVDPSAYQGVNPRVDLEKSTNGEDADQPPGPELELELGDLVTWTYVITNTGDIVLTNIVITDDNGTPTQSADDVEVVVLPTLDPQESFTISREGTAELGQYANVATVTTAEGASDSDPSHYRVEERTRVDLEKSTNGEDADQPPGPELELGDLVTWTYVITNTGDIVLTNIVITDDNGTPTQSADDVEVVVLPTLDPQESFTISREGTAELGQYANVATVTTAEGASDSDPSHYRVGERIGQDGFMTGGGNISPASAGLTTGGLASAKLGRAYSHGFVIRCDRSHVRFQYNDHVNGGRFHLQGASRIVCIDDPLIAPPPPAAPFDTLILEGTGRWNGIRGAQVKFTLTDTGQPARNDFIEIVITLDGVIVSEMSGTLTVGNHQAHRWPPGFPEPDTSSAFSQLSLDYIGTESFTFETRVRNIAVGTFNLAPGDSLVIDAAAVPGLDLFQDPVRIVKGGIRFASIPTVGRGAAGISDTYGDFVVTGFVLGEEEEDEEGGRGGPPGLGGEGPPGLGGVIPPGQGGTPPGQGGIPPGQAKKDE